MVITVTTSEGEWGEDGHIETELKTDTYSSSAGFGEGEPEDMTLGRDLSDAYNIEDMLIEAYEAGKRGETIKVINISEE